MHTKDITSPAKMERVLGVVDQTKARCVGSGGTVRVLPENQDERSYGIAETCAISAKDGWGSGEPGVLWQKATLKAWTAQVSPARRQHDPFVIAVAGGTASGKTTVCDLIIQRLHDQCVAVINQDSFYKVLSCSEKELVKAGGACWRDCPVLHEAPRLTTCIGASSVLRATMQLPPLQSASCCSQLRHRNLGASHEPLQTEMLQTE
jgi:hypothetical protein